MSYSGLGQQSSAISEPPKDPISPLVPVVPMTQGLYTSPTAQSSVRLAPTDWTGVSPWRKEVADLLSSARETPQAPSAAYPHGRYIGQIIPGFDPWYSETVRTLARPATTDEQAGATALSIIRKLTQYSSSYNLGLDSIIAAIETKLSTLSAGLIASAGPAAESVPWLWAAGSFVAGLAACAVFGGKTTPKTTPNRRVRRNRRRHR